jgi:hypothetical protein
MAFFSQRIDFLDADAWIDVTDLKDPAMGRLSLPHRKRFYR